MQREGSWQCEGFCNIALARPVAEEALAAFADVGEAAAEAGNGGGGGPEELAVLVGCLRRTGRLQEALTASRDAAITEVQQAIR